METKLLKKEKTLLRLLSVNFFLILLGIIIVLIKTSVLPEKMPLFYSRPWGEEQLAPKEYLFLIPVVSFIFFIINFQLTLVFIKRSERFLAFLCDSFSLLLTSLGFVTLLRIIILVT